MLDLGSNILLLFLFGQEKLSQRKYERHGAVRICKFALIDNDFNCSILIGFGRIFVHAVKNVDVQGMCVCLKILFLFVSASLLFCFLYDPSPVSQDLHMLN